MEAAGLQRKTHINIEVAHAELIAARFHLPRRTMGSAIDPKETVLATRPLQSGYRRFWISGSAIDTLAKSNFG
jgi:hypothetical protein